MQFQRIVRRGGYWLSAVLVLSASLPLLMPAQAQASTTCHVTNLDPHSVPDGSFTGFAFTITDSARAVAWIKITAPSANIVIVNANSDWLPNSSVSSGDATFTGSAIGAGNMMTAHIDGIVSAFPPDNWLVQTSTDEGGSSPLTCDGDTSINVATNAPPQISGLTTTPGITNAAIVWQTDKPATSHVDYGTSTAYTNNVDDSGITSSHSLALTGLTASTLYHYQVSSTDQQGRSATSMDGTFMTQATPPPPPPPTTGGSGSSTGGTSGSTTTPAPTASAPLGLKVTNTGDKTPPKIRLTSTVAAVSNSEPLLRGTASDETAVARIEYSTDGGQNWLAADGVSGLSSKNASFATTPPHLDDGSYLFVVRAIDGGGNIATSASSPSVIDRQQPTVGAVVLSLGTQTVEPDAEGIVSLTAGVDLNIHTSAVGGATGITLQAVNPLKPSLGGASFSLTHDADSGLWSGVVSIAHPGAYLLQVHSVDGAGNTSDRDVAHLVVQAPGSILSANGPVSSATASVYVLNQDTNNWQLWDAKPFGQSNPQRTSKTGSLRLVLPAGSYYLRITAPGYQSLTTDRFTTTVPTALAPNLQLSQALPIIGGITLGSTALTTTSSSTRASLRRLFTPTTPSDTLLATLQLSSSDGNTERSTDWLGKSTVLCATTTWSPATEALLGPLAQLATNPDIIVRAVGVQENIAKLSAYRAISGSRVTWLADPDGVMLKLGASIAPTCYYINGKGSVIATSYGPQSYDDLLRNLNVL